MLRCGFTIFVNPLTLCGRIVSGIRDQRMLCADEWLAPRALLLRLRGRFFDRRAGRWAGLRLDEWKSLKTQPHEPNGQIGGERNEPSPDFTGTKTTVEIAKEDPDWFPTCVRSEQERTNDVNCQRQYGKTQHEADDRINDFTFSATSRRFWRVARRSNGEFGGIRHDGARRKECALLITRCR